MWRLKHAALTLNTNSKEVYVMVSKTNFVDGTVEYLGTAAEMATVTSAVPFSTFWQTDTRTGYVWDGTGQISAGTTFVPVTSANAAHIITLPAPVPGLEITLQNGATGYEIRTSAPATIGINGGVGANAESAVGANITVVLRCVSATAWIGDTYTAAGVKGVLEVAAP